MPKVFRADTEYIFYNLFRETNIFKLKTLFDEATKSVVFSRHPFRTSGLGVKRLRILSPEDELKLTVFLNNRGIFFNTTGMDAVDPETIYDVFSRNKFLSPCRFANEIDHDPYSSLHTRFYYRSLNACDLIRIKAWSQKTKFTFRREGVDYGC